MKKIIFATSNEGKMKEIRMILKDMPYEVLSLKDAGIKVDIEENGTTFEENAMIKAKTIMNLTNEIVLADDSGLEVDAMDRAPGIYSARFLGEDTSYDIKNNYILEQLKDVPEEKRTARFVCAIACAFPDGTCKTTRATIEGKIGHKIAGENGFGYDPIFFVPEFNCTTAELSPEQKNLISHRAKALNAMKNEL
ncbi:MAG: XTP/dITP diphosphatase [Clostridiales bacterium]|nr:XTP/dITP diphosphatase [Clostridiales bacterium]